MSDVHRIEVILSVPSIEETVQWYERALGWRGHDDVFDAEGHCEFGSVGYGGATEGPGSEQPFVGSTWRGGRGMGSPAVASRCSSTSIT